MRFRWFRYSDVSEEESVVEKDVLTLREVAETLRCSKAHICNLINGKVHGTVPLPIVTVGRRRLVRRSSLHEWLKSSEKVLIR